MLRVARRAVDLITASYERGEIEELEMLTLFDEALRHHGWHLEDKRDRLLPERVQAPKAG